MSLEIIKNLLENPVIIGTFGAIILSQLIKAILSILQSKKTIYEILFADGGMPSSHTTTVSTMSTIIGLTQGFDSPLFGVCIVVSAIVIRDALGVRQQVGQHAIALNKIILKGYFDDIKTLNTRIGHTLSEVLAGFILGVFWGTVFVFLFV